VDGHERNQQPARDARLLIAFVPKDQPWVITPRAVSSTKLDDSSASVTV